jgi:hypothetical protein
MVRAKTVISHPEIGDITVGRVGADKAIATSKDPAAMLLAADLERMLPQTFHARSEPDAKKEQGVDGYSTLLAKVRADGHEMAAAFTIKHRTDGRWYYNSVALSDGKERGRDSYASPGADTRPLGETPIAGLADFVRRTLRRVNPDTVSKVVDRKTGEPLVVYHGTGADFEAFSTDTDSNFSSMNVPQDGIWFAAEPDRAVWYAGVAANKNGGNANTMPVFLALKNPYTHTAQQFADEGISSMPELYYLKKSGHDGVIVERGEYGEGDSWADLKPVTSFDFAAIKPTQIKSSIGNNGAFSPTDARVNFAKAGTIGPRQWPKLQEMITQAEGGHHVAPESDKRPAIAVVQFEALPEPESEFV